MTVAWKNVIFKVKIVNSSDMLIKTHVFHNFDPRFSLFLMRNRYVPFKCPLYNFLRSFKWYIYDSSYKWTWKSRFFQETVAPDVYKTCLGLFLKHYNVLMQNKKDFWVLKIWSRFTSFANCRQVPLIMTWNFQDLKIIFM